MAMAVVRALHLAPRTSPSPRTRSPPVAAATPAHSSTNSRAPRPRRHPGQLGLVQAWPMPFRGPAAGVLGPRPPFSQRQAMVAQHQPATPSYQFTAPPLPSATQDAGAQPWDIKALYTSLGSAGIATTPPSACEWFLDTGASAHMTSNAGSLNVGSEGRCSSAGDLYPLWLAPHQSLLGPRHGTCFGGSLALSPWTPRITCSSAGPLCFPV
ncbi:uncharacterized protein LOC120677498 [Panicum virgatum]|uniref:uncharacterized protein LOC120677498 n=1 Tax=Panicum virgatum TaxID=38727 RepID=UPI0019D62FF7|nr:uncharacterized protein LOC120677498 [Panicum virgatum]